jgi:hypothetical protein
MSDTDELDSSGITPADVQAAVAQFVAEDDASDDKFRGEQLVLGNPEESDLRNMIGLDDNRIFGKLLENTLKTMEAEWYTHGDEEDIANWEYVVNGIACSPEWVPEHVKRSNNAAVFDIGHEGMTLDDFVKLPASQLAGLKKEDVIVVRLYSSSSFKLFNKSMRKKKNPHPIKVSVYVLNEALKKLRKVAAIRNQNEYNKLKVLRRGMKDMKMNFAKFTMTGGTELSFMVHTYIYTLYICMYMYYI